MRKDLLRSTAYAGCLASLITCIAFGIPASLQPASVVVMRESQYAAVFFVQSITVAQIQDDYHATNAVNPVAATPVKSSQRDSASGKKVRILIVPGHQPDVGGTEFNGIYERPVVVDIADALAELLARNPHYDVVVARTRTAWNPVLQSYFDTHATDIEAFRESQVLQMAQHLVNGSILPNADQIYHNTTPSPAALELYGINKWASENKIDITLHLHINDYAGRRSNRVGTYDGFVIYVPDHQYSNAIASKSIGESIAARLSAYHATSTFPTEDAGVVEDQELIAIGSNNSADDAALLIEYGYIYEPQFQKPSVRPLAIADYAYATYLGLQDFFKDPVQPTFGSISFPYDWSKVTITDGVSNPGIYALQSALHYLGYYPPKTKSFSDCPISGLVGLCTRAAINEYQTAHGLEATGILGPKTQAKLGHDLAVP